MRAWNEFIEFLRGTRPRPQPGPSRPVATVLLVSASLAHLPLVYLLVRDVDLPPPFALSVGLLAMALAWSGGVSLEGRRIRTARTMAWLGLFEGAVGVTPVLAEALGMARYAFALVFVLCLGAAVALRK